MVVSETLGVPAKKKRRYRKMGIIQSIDLLYDPRVRASNRYAKWYTCACTLFYVRLTEAETKNVRHGFPELEPFVDSQDTQGPLFSQRLSSMYVDEWTNAYEVVKNIYGGRKCVIVLMEWLEVWLFYYNSFNCTKLLKCICIFILIHLNGTAPTIP